MKNQLLIGVLSGVLAIAALALVQRYTRKGNESQSRMTIVRLEGLPVLDPVYAGDIATLPHSARSPSEPPVYLSQRIGELNLERVSLKEALALLAARAGSGVNLIVQWRELEAAGIESAAPVTLRLRDVTLGQALSLVLNEAGGGSVQLAYATPASFLIISTREQLDRDAGVVRVYDIRALLRDAMAFRESIKRYTSATRPASRWALANESSAGTGRRGSGGGGGRGGFIGRNIPPPTDEEEAVTDLQALIRDLIEVEDWVDNGGRLAHSTYWCGRLVVRNKPSAHRKIEDLLHQLQRLAAGDGQAR